MSDELPDAPPVLTTGEDTEVGDGRTKRSWLRRAGVPLVALLLGGVLGGVVTDDSEQVTELETTVAARTDDVDSLEDDLDALESERERTEQELSDTESELRSTAADLDEMTEQYETAQAEVEALRLKYDPQIRAEAQQAHDAALYVGCQAAIADGSPDYSSLAGLHFDASWGGVLGVDRSDFASAIEGCAAPELAKSFRERCGATPDVELIQKDPDQHVGECYVFIVDVVQFDQATGPCGFRGAWDTTVHDWSYKYRGENGIFDAKEPCDFLAPVGPDDVIRVWATVTGGISYSTTIGGTAHGVGFEVGDAQLVVDN